MPCLCFNTPARAEITQASGADNSTNGGATWSGAYRVNDDADYSLTIIGPRPFGAILLQADCIFTGWIHEVTQVTMKHYIFLYSDNGGTSFATNQAISNEKMLINCSTCGRRNTAIPG
ncbi:MAG: hypothetical protein R2759_00385 [Bacteroidales bacterium]